MMSEMQIHVIARQMFEKHGFEAIAQAAQNALACEGLLPDLERCQVCSRPFFGRIGDPSYKRTARGWLSYDGVECEACFRARRSGENISAAAARERRTIVCEAPQQARPRKTSSPETAQQPRATNAGPTTPSAKPPRITVVA